MVRRETKIGFNDLPGQLPVFPLGGAVLLPHGRLPLNIFEPRYLNMVDHALASNRLIGMVQPRDFQGEHEMDEDAKPALYRVGCAGRLAAFEETVDQRYEIALQGVCRFTVAEELDLIDGFRNVSTDWSPFKGDFDSKPAKGLDRERLRKAAPPFLKLNGIQAEWEVLEGTTDENLINSLAMGCPFASNEKQALLEAATLAERAEILTALIEMALIEQGGVNVINQ